MISRHHVFHFIPLVCLFGMLPAVGTARKNADVSPSLVRQVAGYFRSESTCATQTAPIKQNHWCVVARIENGRYEVPPVQEVYLGVSFRVTQKALTRVQQAARRNPKSVADLAQDQYEEIMTFFSQVTDQEMSTLQIGPSGAKARTLRATTPSEEQTVRCARAQLWKDMAADGGTSPILVLPELAAHLAQLRSDPGYRIKKTKNGGRFSGKSMNAWFTQVPGANGASTYVVLENDTTPDRENIIVNIYPVRPVAATNRRPLACPQI